MRKRIFEIIETADEDDKASKAYDLVMMVTIVLSIIPLAFKEKGKILITIDYITAIVFIVDYVLRLMTADYKLAKSQNNCKIIPFIRYIFTPMAIIDLVAILPTFTAAMSGLKLLKFFRLVRTFRIFKIFRYSRNIVVISNVIKKQKEPLLAVCILAAAYILICALVIFNVEPDTFENFFAAIYWATVSLTTMGYGDIYPVSTVGRIVTMLSSFIGIAIVALPAGIITAGYMDEIKKD